MCWADDLRLPLSTYAGNGDPPREVRQRLVTALEKHLSYERSENWKELQDALEDLSRNELNELVILLVGRMSYFLRESPKPVLTSRPPGKEGNNTSRARH